MQDLGSERKFKMSSKDALFTELLEARNNSQEVAVNKGTAVEASASRDNEYGADESIESSYQLER